MKRLSTTIREKATGAVLSVMQHVQLGTKIEHAVKPIAVALKLDCLDEEKRLKPESPCGQRRDWLNGKQANSDGATH